MKKTIKFYALLLFCALILCSCSTQAIPSVTHTPGDSGYIPVYPEISIPSTSKTPSTATSVINVTTVEDLTPSVFTETPTATPLPPLPDPDFTCPQCFVYDMERSCFLYLKGGETVIYPASTTKLLTILFARTLLSLDLVVTPGDELELLLPNSSLAYIRNDSGHKLTVEQLIEAMLLPSGNDAAYVLAAAGGRALKPDSPDGKSAVSAFMEGMNRYARQLGLVGSVFITPDGYDVEGHFSTLEDMALVAREAYNDEIIRKYAALPEDNVIYASGHTITWHNTNSCINPDSPYYVPEVNGLKTGTKEKNYYCLISSAEIGGGIFIFGFFGAEASQDRFTDTQKAVEWIKTCVLQ